MKKKSESKKQKSGIDDIFTEITDEIYLKIEKDINETNVQENDAEKTDKGSKEYDKCPESLSAEDQ